MDSDKEIPAGDEKAVEPIESELNRETVKEKTVDPTEEEFASEAVEEKAANPIKKELSNETVEEKAAEQIEKELDEEITKEKEKETEQGGDSTQPDEAKPVSDIVKEKSGDNQNKLPEGAIPKQPALTCTGNEDSKPNLSSEGDTDQSKQNVTNNCVKKKDVQSTDSITKVKSKQKTPTSGSSKSSLQSFSIIQAIKDKYEDDGVGSMPSFVMFVSKGTAGKAGPEDLFVPNDLYLNNAGISTVGDESKLKKLCSEVTELHLADNDIRSWSEVAKIARCLPQLTCLNLSSNPVVREPLSCEEHSLDGFPNLVKLILNYCHISWDTVNHLLGLLPSLFEIHLSFNEFHTVDVAAFNGNTYDSVNVLNINGNQFTSWQEISKLGQLFPNLKVLYMLDVPLSELPEGEDVEDVIGENFPVLEQLCLKDCPIDKWESLEKFRYLPSLVHLKLLGKIPLLQDLDDKVRQQMILAYLPTLTHLNGGRLTETEKDDADRAFIRFFMDKEEKPARYHELEAQYGKLDPLAEVDFSTIDSVHILVSFDEGKKKMHTVNLSWTLGELYDQLEPVYGKPLRRSHMMIHTSMDDRFTNKMVLFQRSLRGYNVHDGDVIEVLEKPDWQKWSRSKAGRSGKKNRPAEEKSKDGPS